MNVFGVIISQLLACAVIVAVFLYAIRRNRLRMEAHLISLDETMKAEVSAARAEVERAKMDIPAILLLSLDLLDEDTVPDFAIGYETSPTSGVGIE